MKKIGILTFHAACNYGAFLQAYSLQKKLNQYEGVSAEIVDYICPAIEDTYKLSSLWKENGNPLKKAAKCVLRAPAIIRRNKMFQRAREELRFGAKRIDSSKLHTIERDYDLFIVGSDQVWNSELTREDENYLLSFVHDDRKKVSYAASMGEEKFLENHSKQVELLKKFRYLSVREKEAVLELSQATGRDDILSCVDPVFLTSCSEWLAYAQGGKGAEIDYILVFAMGSGDRVQSMIRFAQKEAEKSGKKLFYLSDQERFYKYRDIPHLKNVLPCDFVRLIAEADCVITNSFHATAFSILFHRHFWVETNVRRNGRITNLLQLCDLNQCALFDGVPKDEWHEINWRQVDELLSQEIERSLRYIDRILD